MTNKIKKAFDGIRAEDKLKANTMAFLQTEVRRKAKLNKNLRVKRLSIAIASFVILFFTGTISYNAYFTASAYVDVDVNPSIELTINRFDKVIGVHAYNTDGEKILSELNLQHKSIKDSVPLLVGVIIDKGYAQDSGLVSVTLQSSDKSKENELLSTLKTDVETILYDHHSTAQVDVFTVSTEIRTHAHDQNISPAKYLAILELQEVDPTVTVESCKDHTISEIREWTLEDSGGHHGNDNNTEINGSNTESENGNHHNPTNNQTNTGTSSNNNYGNDGGHDKGKKH